MQQVIEYVVCKEGDDTDAFDSAGFSARRIETFDDVIILQIQSGDIAAKHLYDTLSSLGYKKYFEHYWLRRADDGVEGDLIQNFFSVIASSYDEIIAPEINIACYSHLIRSALDFFPGSSPRALDFGCGTGLLTKCSERTLLGDVVGYDFSAKMAEKARNAGLDVLSESQFEGLPSNSFDLVLMNYVLHFGVKAGTLERLQRLLRRGGILVANVHKNLNAESALKAIESGEVQGSTFTSFSRFGSVITFQRS